MSHQTCRVLYAKYNSTRSPDYRVTTEICEDANGLFVRKRADGEAAGVHLETIRQNGDLLRDYYTDIKVIASEADDGALRFPYVRGRTLAEQIDTYHFDKARFIDEINQKLASVLSVRKQYRVPFEPTPEFEAMFGAAEIGEVPALNPANIDSLLTNFIENDTGIYCIDCEWVCRFPVPVDYIRYRILLYLYVTQIHARLDGVSLGEMLDWFGFSEQECQRYWQMDDHFQQVVHGEGRKYMYPERYRKRNLVVDDYDRMMREKTEAIAEKDAVIRKMTQDYQAITNSFFWRVFKPARVAMEATERAVRKHDGIFLFLRIIKDTARHGFKYAWDRREQFLAQKRAIRAVSEWPAEAERARQRQALFPRAIRFSILVPLYNTPERFLREMIQSVRDQTYGNWELCLADGSDEDHAYVGRVCRELSQAEPRIRYQKLEKNLGISGNTNACIDMATGDYIALFDHDDLLHPSALYEVMKAICNQDADYIYTDEATFESPDRSKIITLHYKPDFAPDNLLANNYICHFSVFSAQLLKAVGGFRSEYDGSQDHDIILRLTGEAKRVVHIPQLLYWWRSHPQSVAQDIGAKEYAVDAARRAVRDYIKVNKHVDAVVRSTNAFPTIFQIVYPIERRAKVSVIIPNKDHAGDLRRCVDSIIRETTYDNYEIVIVENNSADESTFRYYDELRRDRRIRVLRYEEPFNYSRINNWAVRQSDGEYVLLLNNDTEVINADWMENMLMYAQRGDVGAVGAKLYFPDGRIQHAGIILKLGADRVAGHAHYGAESDNLGYMGRLCYAQDVSAVTAACLMVSRDKYEAVNGFDETLAVALNDVDFCLKLRGKGYLNIFTPFAELRHYESSTRGSETGKNKQRFNAECDAFKKRWGAVLDKGDPYYNPNFSLDSSMFEPIGRTDIQAAKQ